MAIQDARDTHLRAKARADSNDLALGDLALGSFGQDDAALSLLLRAYSRDCLLNRPINKQYLPEHNPHLELTSMP